MAGLTIKQLEQLEDVLRWGDMAANASGRIYDAIDIVRAEIARRKHGPFTRSEAIASGRAFRRKGSGPWANAMLLSEDETACDYELAPAQKLKKKP